MTGTATPSLGGTYTGTLSQGYHFTVVSGGTVGVDPITIAWTSDSGEAGTVTVPTSYTGQQLNVGDGISLTLGTGTLKTNDTFGAGGLRAASDARRRTRSCRSVTRLLPRPPTR